MKKKKTKPHENTVFFIIVLNYSTFWLNILG